MLCQVFLEYFKLSVLSCSCFNPVYTHCWNPTENQNIFIKSSPPLPFSALFTPTLPVLHNFSNASQHFELISSPQKRTEHIHNKTKPINQNHKRVRKQWPKGLINSLEFTFSRFVSAPFNIRSLHPIFLKTVKCLNKVCRRAIIVLPVFFL